MPPRKRASSVLNGDARKQSQVAVEDSLDTTDFDDALALAEVAEAEALAAEADAAAARARARALKLRRQATASMTARTARAPAETAPAETAPTETAPTETETAAAETIATVDLAKTRATDRDSETLDSATVLAAKPKAPHVSVLTSDATDVMTTDEDLEDLDDSADVDGSEDRDDVADKPARRRRFRLGMPSHPLKWVAATVAIVCTLGFLAASGYMVVHHRQVAAEQQRSEEFAAAARQGVVTLMSLNFNSAKDDVKRIIDNTTGDFKKDFEGQADEFARVAQASKVITEATVNATAVQSMTGDNATVLVAVTTQVSNTASKDPQPRSWRLRVDVARDGGQLKLSKVEFVP